MASSNHLLFLLLFSFPPSCFPQPFFDETHVKRSRMSDESKHSFAGQYQPRQQQQTPRDQYRHQQHTPRDADGSPSFVSHLLTDEELEENERLVNTIAVDPVTGKSCVSLLNFDQHANSVTLTSPRSVEACRRLGIVPNSLLARPVTYFEEMLYASHDVDPELVPDFAEKKFKHCEANRQNDLKACRDKRRDIILNPHDGDSNASIGQHHAKVSALIKGEEKSVQSMQRRQLNMLTNILSSEISRAAFAARTRDRLKEKVEREEMTRIDELLQALAGLNADKAVKMQKRADDVRRGLDGGTTVLDEARYLAFLQDARLLRSQLQMAVESEERKDKAEKFKQSLEEQHQRHLEELRRKEQELSEKEQHRQRTLENQRREHAEEMFLHKARSAQRVLRARANLKSYLERKREQFLIKEQVRSVPYDEVSTTIR